ncbi:CheR family methyltransferase [Pseudomonas sp. NPDC047963]|nr:SAM-dependent methyltransferase [Phycisphaerae bacterium]MCH2340870.1 protein-glutamate O-methyltransferase CheR [Pseudomonas sp.]
METIALNDAEFRQFRGLIHEVAGISLSDAKKPLVAGRLGKRLRQRGLTSYGDYFRLLQRESSEHQIAVDLLTTNETYFFREPKHFDFLRQLLQGELRSRPGPLRIWSGACSSGEEPYTIAMLLAEHLGQRPWEVLASDLSTRILEQARAGTYPLEEAEGIPRELLHKYCLKGTGRHEGLFGIDPVIAKRVHFSQINLNTTLPDVGQFDVIFLRNVMIYFNQDTKRKVMERLLAHLRPGGYFIISHSESLNGISDAVKVIKPSIYRKPDA